MEKGKKYLSDILYAVSLIEEFSSSIDDFHAYVNDQKTKSAVERQLAIVGEALNKYLKLDEANHFENAKQIISFRNWLVHAYDSIDDTVVWGVIKKHLPLLKKEALEKLSK